MQTFYEPKGAAREYAPLALNIYNGCTHGCTYCYAPGICRRSREDFRTNVKPRAGLVEAIRKYLAKSVPTQTVLLSFLSDPYQPLERECRLTRAALQEMDGKGMDVAILTKSIFVEDDFELIAKNGWHVGTTFTYRPILCNPMKATWEPYASESYSRLVMLRYADGQGIKTFVSCEPVISESELEIIFEQIAPLKLASGVRIGKWNHDKEAERIDWKAVLQMSLDFAKATGHRVYIKDSLAQYGDVPPEYRIRPFG
jgi:DNA repair photolyase